MTVSPPVLTSVYTNNKKNTPIKLKHYRFNCTQWKYNEEEAQRYLGNIDVFFTVAFPVEQDRLSVLEFYSTLIMGSQCVVDNTVVEDMVIMNDTHRLFASFLQKFFGTSKHHAIVYKKGGSLPTPVSRWTHFKEPDYMDKSYLYANMHDVPDPSSFTFDRSSIIKYLVEYKTKVTSSV